MRCPRHLSFLIKYSPLSETRTRENTDTRHKSLPPFPLALYVPHLADTAQIFSDVALWYYFHKGMMLFVIAPRSLKNKTFHFTAVFMMHNPRRALPHELSKVLLGQCMLVMPLLYTNTGFCTCVVLLEKNGMPWGEMMGAVSVCILQRSTPYHQLTLSFEQPVKLLPCHLGATVCQRCSTTENWQVRPGWRNK